MNERLALFPVLLLTAMGCQPNIPAPSESPAVTSTGGEVASQADSPQVHVELASWSDVEKRIAAHRGKIVVLDVWSNWCAPCMAEFPNLVKLQQQHGSQLAGMSLNCNYAGIADEPPDSSKKEVEAFLQKQRATFENFICTDSDEKLFTTLNAAAIPIVRVYDQEGKLAKQFVNDDNEYGEKGFTYAEHITPLVESLLKR